MTWWRRLISRTRRQGTPSPITLPTLEREVVQPFLTKRHGLSQVDWGMVELWIARHHPDSPALARRAVVAAWLQVLRDELDVDHQAWREARFDGLTPMVDNLGRRIRSATQASFRELTRALAPIRGEDAIPDVAIVGLRPNDAYISFVSAFMPAEGHWATSGGMYIRPESSGYPILTLNLATAHSAESTIAHELTHHALADQRIPLWIEEGITQMMEERVTGITSFRMDAETVAAQRRRWDGEDLSEFLSGESHLSPNDQDQELAYHLSQWVVRSLLHRRKDEMFSFLRDCATVDAEDACQRHLGCSLKDLVIDATGFRTDTPDE